MSDVGPRRCTSRPGIVVDGKLDHDRPRRDQPRHPHPARQLVLRRLAGRRDVRRRTIRSATRSTSGTRGTRPRLPRPQKRDFDGKYTWVMSPRWFDKRTGEHLALDTGGGPLARLWVTALAGTVDIGYVKATGNEREDPPAEDRERCPRRSSSGRSRSGATRSSATARARYFQAYAAAAALYFVEQALARGARRPHARPGPSSRCRTRRSAAASTRRCAACSRITS